MIITEAMFDRLPENDQAAALCLVGETVEYDDVKDVFTREALKMIFGKEEEMQTQNVVNCLGYGLIPRTKGDFKLVGKTVDVEPKDLSKALLVDLVKILAEERDDLEKQVAQAQTERYSLPSPNHDHMVIRFLRHVGLFDGLTEKKKAWMRNNTDRFVLKRIKDRNGKFTDVWTIGYERSFYENNKDLVKRSLNRMHAEINKRFDAERISIGIKVKIPNK